MSALPPKADITECDWHVRFVPEAEVAGTVLDPMLAGSFDDENVSKRCEAIDNDVPIVLCFGVCCLTWPTFRGPIDVGGAHAVRTCMSMIIIMSSHKHDGKCFDDSNGFAVIVWKWKEHSDAIGAPRVLRTHRKRPCC